MIHADVAIYAVVRVVVDGLTASTEDALIAEAVRRASFNTLPGLPGWETEICRYEIVTSNTVRIFHDREFLDGMHEDRVAEGAGVWEL